MNTRQRISSLAATACLLLAGTLAGAAPSHAASSDPRCTGDKTPPSGTMCVHFRNMNTGAYYWYGPLSACSLHDVPIFEVMTWVKSNQTGNVKSSYYEQNGGDQYLGSLAAVFSGRPPGYVDAYQATVGSYRVC